MKKYSGDSFNWNRNFNEDNNFWENIEIERFINDESNIHNESNIYDESVLIKMKRFTYLSMDLILTPFQKKCYLDYHKYEGIKDRIQIIADELGITPATVYKHIRIANAKMYAMGNLFLKSYGYKSYYDGIKNIFSKALNLLDYDEREVVKQYYLYGNNTSYIAKKFDLSKNEIHKLCNSGTRKLIKKTSLSKKHLLDLRHSIRNNKMLEKSKMTKNLI